MAKKRLNHLLRKQTCPAPNTKVKFAHTCETDKRTKLGTPAWNANNSEGAKRVDAIRHLHQATGSHQAAVVAVAKETQRNVNRTIDSVQTRTLVRVVEKLTE